MLSLSLYKHIFSGCYYSLTVLFLRQFNDRTPCFQFRYHFHMRMWYHFHMRMWYHFHMRMWYHFHMRMWYHFHMRMWYHFHMRMWYHFHMRMWYHFHMRMLNFSIFFFCSICIILLAETTAV